MPHRVPVLALVLLMTACQPGGADFDSQAWSAGRPASQAGASPRLAMAETLVAGHLRAGMTRQAVKSLLGAPDFQDDTRDVWDLGFPPMRMDMATLVVDYDAAGLLREARVQLN